MRPDYKILILSLRVTKDYFNNTIDEIITELEDLRDNKLSTFNTKNKYLFAARKLYKLKATLKRKTQLILKIFGYQYKYFNLNKDRAEIISLVIKEKQQQMLNQLEEKSDEA